MPDFMQEVVHPTSRMVTLPEGSRHRYWGGFANFAFVLRFAFTSCVAGGSDDDDAADDIAAPLATCTPTHDFAGPPTQVTCRATPRGRGRSDSHATLHSDDIRR